MTRDEFRQLLEQGVFILDGATGTNLQKAGMPVGVCPELWIMEHPQAIQDLQRQFVEAGSRLVYAPTFTGNRIKLAEYGLEDRLIEINTRLVKLSKEAVGDKALVAGDMTMTGQQLYPMGTLTFEELVDVYKEQARALYEAGCDVFIVETMMSLQETRAAVLAIREVCDLPVMATLTFEADGRTLYGTPPEAAVVVLQELGVDAIGTNCSTGPLDMVERIRAMYRYATVPLIAKPNAGLPEIVDGKTVYQTTPEEFARDARLLVEAGARIIGGCCGTTVDHIRALHDAVRDMRPQPVSAVKKCALASERSVVEITLDGPFQVIGERINPTGKKKLQAELRAGSMAMVRSFARQQEKDGAAVLDINMGTNGIDEKDMMIRAVYEVTAVTGLPLCIDSSFPEVIEAALRIYPGRALINSISLEGKKCQRLLKAAKKYGAMFIALPVSDAGLPKSVEEKHGVIRSLVKQAEAAGLAREDIIVDGLVGAVGALPTAALDCLATFRYCHDELQIPTVCGLSNISFGLPGRIYANMTFLSMAIASGLTMAIANPGQDLLMNAAAAANMLMNRAGSDLAYIRRIRYVEKKEEEKRQHQPPVPPAGPSAQPEGSTKQAGSPVNGNPVYQAVLNGEKDTIISCTEEELHRGKGPEDIINQLLIPAINKVGQLYNDQYYFLPQLIASAAAMETAIHHLEPMIQRSSSEKLPTIVVATVEGDVHDIGKNLVALMLRNYGYEVIDLGKDVPASAIIEKALSAKAAVVGLSALMTTTMMHMKDVIAEAVKRHYDGKIIIGGAAVTPSFADEIGADGYSKDAADCVKLVGRLLK